MGWPPTFARPLTALRLSGDAEKSARSTHEQAERRRWRMPKIAKPILLYLESELVASCSRASGFAVLLDRNSVSPATRLWESVSFSLFSLSLITPCSKPSYPCSMVVSPREAATPLPPLPAEEVPPWVEGNQIGIYVNAVLATLVIYDASMSTLFETVR